MTGHNHLAARESVLLHTQAAHRVDLSRQAVVESHLGRNGITQACGVVMDAVARLITGFLAFKGQRYGEVTSRRITAEDGLCRIILGKAVVLISQYHSLDVLVGDGLTIVFDLVGFAGQRHDDVLALLDHGIEGGPVGSIILSHLDDDGVEVAVVQLFGKGAGRTGLVQVKTLDLGIIGTAAREHGFGPLGVADGGHGNASALQVVDRQNVVVVLDDGDAACRELALEHSSLL